LCRLSSVRLWLTVVLVSAGLVSAILAVAPGGPGGTVVGATFDDCWKSFGSCNSKCTRQYKYGNGLARDGCYRDCEDALYKCFSRSSPASVGGGTPGQNLPPNAVNPISSPSPSATPRKYPIKGPPRKLGPSPSPTAHPILLAKPTSPTPSPKPTPKKSSHGHH
jgi:hypothetical protein